MKLKPISIDTSNALYGAKGCENLPATVRVNEDGKTVIETVWEMSEVERKIVSKTGLIVVEMIGGVPPMKVSALSFTTPTYHPPFSFAGEEPIEQGCPFEESAYNPERRTTSDGGSRTELQPE